MRTLFAAAGFVAVLGACAGGAGGPGGAGQLAQMPTASNDMRDQVEVRNGAYDDWAGFQPGSWIRSQQIEDKSGSRRESFSRTTLVEKTPARIVVQYGDSPGSTAAYGPTTFARAADRGPASDEKIAEGDENLVIRGIVVPCRWTEYTFVVAGSTCALKTWRSREMPGAVVRNVQVWTSAGQLERTMTTTVVDWHIER